MVRSGSDCCCITTRFALGRVANFINGELLGKSNKSAVGVIFPGELAQAVKELLGRWETSLYEADSRFYCF